MKKRKPAKPSTRSKIGVFTFERETLRDLLILVGLALLLRVIYLVQLSDSLVYGKYILDSLVIDRHAVEIAGGNFWGDTAFFRAPLYSYLIGILYAIFGQTPTPYLVVQLLLGLATVVSTYFCARYLFDRKVALISGVIIACWPTLIYFGGELMITTLAVFWAPLLLLSLQVAVDRNQPRLYVVAGVILGLAAITRPTFLPLLALVPLHHLIKLKHDRLKLAVRHAILIVLGLLIPVLPVTIRNLAVAGDPALISTQGGVNFFLGNQRDADGISVSMPALGPIMQGGKYQDNVWTSSVQIAEHESGRELSQSEVSSYWFGRGLDEIAAAPIRAVGLFFKKNYFFWHGQEIFNNKSPYYAGSYSWLLDILLWKAGLNFPSGLLFPLLLVGVYLGFKNRKRVSLLTLLLLIFSLTVSLFFVCSRFRQPLVPLAAIMAASALVEIVRLFKRKRSQAWPLLGAFVVLVVLLNLGGNVESKINLSQHHNVIGNLYFANGDFNNAAIQFEEAIRINPQNAQSYGSLGAAYGKSGRLNDAERVLRQAVEYHPRSSEFHFNLGLVYKQSGRNDQAESHFRTAIDLDPKAEMPYLGLGAILEERNQPDSARAVYQDLQRQRPDSWKARSKLESLAP